MKSALFEYIQNDRVSNKIKTTSCRTGAPQNNEFNNYSFMNYKDRKRYDIVRLHVQVLITVQLPKTISQAYHILLVSLSAMRK